MKTFREQATDTLRALIDGEYEPGDRLPAEPELARRIGHSRNTIREAIGQLVSEGRLDRRWGVGTTVLARQEPPVFSMTDVRPVRQIIEASGHVPSLLRFVSEVVTPPDDTAAALGLDPGERVLSVERLFAVDGAPAVQVADWCRTHVDGVRLDFSGLEDVNVDLPSLVLEQTGRVLERLEGRIDAVMPSQDFLADGRAAQPLVQISQTVLTREDLPVVYTVIRFDTSVVDLTIRRAFQR